MGTFQQRMEIARRGASDFTSMDALVDTGAFYSWVPADVLGQLRVEPDDRVPFILADGTERYYDTAWVQVRLDGKTQFTICVFGTPVRNPC